MIRNDSNHMMMIEPTSAPSAEPVLDVLTSKMAAALNSAQHKNRYRGVHTCTGQRCRAVSDNTDWIVGTAMTNSLAVHYLAHHRGDVPLEELQKIAALNVEPVTPDVYQLTGMFRPDMGRPIR